MSCPEALRNRVEHTFWKCHECGALNSLIERNYCTKCHKGYNFLEDELIYVK